MPEAAAVAAVPLVIGRYALFDELAAGGMATVHLGRLLGTSGFGRTVAVKRLHAHYLSDPEFMTMFMDEARIVSRIRHPNVVAMVDVVQSDKGLFLVMEYIHGESLSRLMRTARKSGERIPPKIVTAIMHGVLLGLHSAHDTKGPDGELLGVVHRDVSPQNIIIGADGSARVLDFGIAKAAGRAQVTREGQIKGKLAYMAPEQIRGKVDRRTDVFAASVVMWEMLTGRRLHEGHKDVDIVMRVVKGDFPAPRTVAPELPAELDAIVLRGLATNPDQRYACARDMALELERHVGLATPSEVAAWVERLAPDVLQARSNLVSAMELAANDLIALESNPPPPSLALSDPGVPPPPSVPDFPVDDFPVDVDFSHTAPEAPSSSAIFAHGQRPPSQTGPASGGLHRTTWLVIVAAAMFALVGIILGALALTARTNGPLSPPAARPSATAPRKTELGGPQGSTASAIKTAPSSVTSSAEETTAPPPNNPAISTPSATASTPPVATWKPPALGTPPPAKPGAKAKECTPPYTIDDVGHRHYKPECMGLD